MVGQKRNGYDLEETIAPDSLDRVPQACPSEIRGKCRRAAMCDTSEEVGPAGNVIPPKLRHDSLSPSSADVT
jgi:hypothetical protein